MSIRQRMGQLADKPQSLILQSCHPVQKAGSRRKNFDRIT